MADELLFHSKSVADFDRSGVFDPNHKCPLGIISGKFPSHTIEGDKEVAKNFAPAVAIRDFMPVEFALKRQPASQVSMLPP